MAKFRHILTALIVCALAILPVASASAAMRMAGTMGTSHVAKSDAAPPAMHEGCENHAKMALDNGGGASAPPADHQVPCSHDGCAKCPCLGLAAHAVLAAASATPAIAHAVIRTAHLTPDLPAPAFVPPSPPPRV